VSKNGDLQYSFLKNNGNILVFRINLETKFKQIKEKCCEFWLLSEKVMTLYDDAFNNLECCLNAYVLEFFNGFTPTDKSFKQGEICFYLIEKLKNQKELLDTQEKCKKIKFIKFYFFYFKFI
jgi:hypothetical protein